MTAIDQVCEFFLSKPLRIVDCGKVFFWTGSMLLISGLLGRVCTTAVSFIPQISGQPAQSKSLEDVYSSLPTWWIPESPFGYVVAALLIVIGLIVIMTGKKLVKLIGE